MSDVLIDTMRSLTGVMLDETRLLTNGRRGEVEALAAAKLKLTARLEKQVAVLERDDPAWQGQLPAERKAALLQALEEMQAAAAENGRWLQRQIELSRELMDVIAAEAKRVGGTRSQVYRAGGGLHRSDLPAPISINARL